MPENAPYPGEDPEAAKKRIGAAGAQAQALETLPSPAPTPPPAPTARPTPPPEMMEYLKANPNIFDPATQEIIPGLGTTGALMHERRRRQSGDPTAVVPAWLEQLLEAAKSGTPFSKMKWGTERIRTGDPNAPLTSRPVVK